jgi:hypothetical protein
MKILKHERHFPQIFLCTWKKKFDGILMKNIFDLSTQQGKVPFPKPKKDPETISETSYLFVQVNNFYFDSVLYSRRNPRSISTCQMCGILIITQQKLTPFRGRPMCLKASKVSRLKHFCKIIIIIIIINYFGSKSVTSASL